jgi:demethylmenaquinone methyltransferase/2-methoxy-6-polyprenyl-1,4-benzoquinol methylase
MPFKQNSGITHFGYHEVPIEQKANLVAKVFQSVAPNYDLMNDLMSFGLHRLWKRYAIDHAVIRPGHYILDVAAGTGDLSKAFARLVGPKGKVIMTDINEDMISTGRNRLIDAGLIDHIEYVQADAECLPFANNSFDCITIAFGLRNITNKTAALLSMYRVLKPGGRLLILEFSQAHTPLINKLYDFYSFHIIPKMGELIAQDRMSYQYLVESIRMHPNQDTLKAMLIESGFEDVDYFNLCDGIVALHKGFKY